MKAIVLSISCLVLLSQSVFAQQQQEEGMRDTTYYLAPVIVTPTQARERETPATFSNMNKRQIDERYSVQDIPVLLSELPSTTFYSESGNGIGYSYLTLRGFDQRRLSVMVNGVPQNDPEDHNVYWIDMPDLMGSIDDIQVQRGAGSAFYGPPAIGGSINFVSNPFQRTYGVTLESMVGFQGYDADGSLPLNTRKFTAAINSGLIEDHYMLYGKLGRLTSEGYRTHSWAEMNSFFVGLARFDEKVTTRVHLYGGPINDALAYVGIPKYYNGDSRLRRTNYSYWEYASSGDTVGFFVETKPQSKEHFSQPHFEILNEWKITPRITLSNTAFYVQGDGYFDYDGDWVAYGGAATEWFRNYVGYDSTFGVSSFPSILIRGFVGNKQWGWLPRVEIQHESGSLTLGAEVRIHRSTHWGRIEEASEYPSPSFDPDFHFYDYRGEKDIFSLYGHEVFRLDEKFTLMADLQLVRNRYGVGNEKFLGTTMSVPYLFANPRFGVNYNINEEWNAYLSLAYTTREPRLRNLYAAEDAYFGATPQFQADTTGGGVRYDFDKPLATPEQLLDIELGTGLRTARAHLAVNAFWMEFTDELVKSGQVDIFGQPVTGNAERTRHLGLEIDGAYELTNRFSLSGNVSVSRNRLVSYQVIGDDGNRVALDGNPIAGFPDFLGNLRLTYRTEELAASVAGKYVGPFYTDNFKNEQNKNDAYTVVNLETSYRLPKVRSTTFTLRGEVRNVFNRFYLLSGEGNTFFPAAERNYLVGVTVQF